MPANTKHPCFNQPENENEKIWRYMDFTKYVSLLESQSLYFSRANLLGDPFEGSIPKANMDLKDDIHSDIPLQNREAVFKLMSDARKEFTNKMFINCWHMNPHESAAMWNLYSKSNEGVAICSTYKKLTSVLDSEALIGIIKYIDYENYLIKEDNIFWPFVHKRKSFSHESEIRAIIHQFEPLDEYQEGMIKPVDLNVLIESVFVSPNSQNWYFEIVKKITEKYGLHKEVKRSKLSDDPIF